MKKALLLAGLYTAFAAASAAAAGVPVQVSGDVLTASNGMTLYTFDQDGANSGKSACNGSCATNWPPLVAKADAKAEGDFSLIMREGGARQWIFKGKPLYFWSGDQKPGERNGDGFKGLWRAARP